MMKWKHHKEDYSADVDVARSIAILDRVISEFDDIESDFPSVADGVGSVKLGNCRTQSGGVSNTSEAPAIFGNDPPSEKSEDQHLVDENKKESGVPSINIIHETKSGSSPQTHKSNSMVKPFILDDKKSSVRSVDVVLRTSSEKSKSSAMADKRYPGLVQNYVSEVESRISDENIRNHTKEQIKSPSGRELSPRLSKPKRSNSDTKCSSNIATKQANLRALGLFQPVSKPHQLSPSDKKNSAPVMVRSWKASAADPKESSWTKNRIPPTPSAQPVLPPLPLKLMQRQLSSPHISLVPSKTAGDEISSAASRAKMIGVNRYVSSVNLNQEQTRHSGSSNSSLGSQQNCFQTPKRSLSTANLSTNHTRVAKKTENISSAIDRLSSTRPDFKKKTVAPLPPQSSCKAANLKETVNVRLNSSRLKDSAVNSTKPSTTSKPDSVSALSQVDLNTSSSFRYRCSSGSGYSPSHASDTSRLSSSIDRAIPQLPTKTKLVRRYSSDQGTLSTQERRPHARKKKERESSSGSSTLGAGTSSLPSKSASTKGPGTSSLPLDTSATVPPSSSNGCPGIVNLSSKASVSGSNMETVGTTGRTLISDASDARPQTLLEPKPKFQPSLSPLAALNIGTCQLSNGTSVATNANPVRAASVAKEVKESEPPRFRSRISGEVSNSSSPNTVSTDDSDSSPGNRNSRRQFSSSRLSLNKTGFHSTPNSSLEMKSSLTTCSSGSGMQKTLIFSPIVKDRLNDNSNMYIPAPPSPRPDYYESELSETDSITDRCLDDEVSINTHDHFAGDIRNTQSNSQLEVSEQSAATTSIHTRQDPNKTNRDCSAKEKRKERSNKSIDQKDILTRNVSKRPDHNEKTSTVDKLSPFNGLNPKSLLSKTPLDVMIEDFHRNLPPPPPPPAGFEDLSSAVADESNSTVEDFFVEPDDSYYSDDSLDTSEENREKYSRRRRRKSDWMTTSSFDFIHHREARKRVPTKLSIRDEGISSLESHNSASDDNDNAARRCLSIENLTPLSSRSKQAMAFEQNHKKFDSIRKLLREGKLEGLCSPPPSFTPPPPPVVSCNVKNHKALGRQFSHVDSPTKRYISPIDQPVVSSPRRSLSQAHITCIASESASRNRNDPLLRRPAIDHQPSRNPVLSKSRNAFNEPPVHNKSVLKVSYSSSCCNKSGDDGLSKLHHFKEYPSRTKPARRPPEGARTNALTHLEPSNFLLPLNDSALCPPSPLHKKAYQGCVAPSSLPLVLISEGQQKVVVPAASSKHIDDSTRSLPSQGRADSFSAANGGFLKQRCSVAGHKLSFSNKEKEACETRGKFRIFKGFWRRKQYSLEHA